MDDVSESKRGRSEGDSSCTTTLKQHKPVEIEQKKEFPQTRRVVMHFSSTGLEVPARIVYREKFGILARAEEDRDTVRAGDSFWTKWSGQLQPLTMTPVVEVVHAVKNDRDDEH